MRQASMRRLRASSGWRRGIRRGRWVQNRGTGGGMEEGDLQSKPRLSLRSSPASRFCSAAGSPSSSSDSASTSRVMAASTRVRPAGLISTRMPRPSLGSVWRVTSPRSTSRSMRFVIVPLETSVCCSSCLGESRYGVPARRSAESTSNSDASSSSARTPVAAPGRGASRAARPGRAPAAARSRGRAARSQSPTIRSTSSASVMPPLSAAGMPRDACRGCHGRRRGQDRVPWQTGGRAGPLPARSAMV